MSMDGLVRPQQPRYVRFNDFELDLKTHELRRSGQRIRLQNKPFRVLQLLVENAGDVVTREELHQRVWPGETSVALDTGLNTAVNRVRQALSDTADNPRFIETLSRRGYRFLAPVEVIDMPAPVRPRTESGSLPARGLKHMIRKLLLLVLE
jgi:DNA-binding winged helix-turn-helix (wHTH) protein